jgi:acetolactate synthase-1/2/3 large subunit
MTVAEFIANFIKKKKIKSIFMLTGYGAMYLNDAIKKSGIKYYATRNEATAPIMAEAYAKVKGGIGVACVTAGPGATNAIPGLAEAFVDSAPILIISGQVDLKQTTYNTRLKNIRTFGTAEINIIPIVRPLTKYAEIIKNPNDVRYILEKAFFIAQDQRPGPVWIDVPLNIQKSKINFKKLKKFIKPTRKEKIKSKKYFKIIKYFNKCKKPILICGGGVKSSNTYKDLKKIINYLKIPVFFSRAAQDLDSHNKKYIFGQTGIKGSRFCKKIMTSADLILSLGCRLSPQLAGHNFEAFSNAKIIAVDVINDELKKKGAKIFLPINEDLKFFIPNFLKILKKNKINNFKTWFSHCENLKNTMSIWNNKNNKNPIDLYDFMNKLGNISPAKSILVTDAGSNYYIGGQVWKFNKGQKELTSISNAAMGLTIPLAIGAAVASSNKVILGVTGDGSLELNIQELKTISHYRLNIKLFVINNGGYVSMHNWADTFFKGRRLDTPEDTGDGTLNLKKIANAFDLKHYLITNTKKINSDIKNILSIRGPVFVEVITDHNQKIFDAFKDY